MTGTKCPPPTRPAVPTADLNSTPQPPSYEPTPATLRKPCSLSEPDQTKTGSMDFQNLDLLLFGVTSVCHSPFFKHQIIALS